MEKISWFESWFNSPYYKVLYHHRDDAEAAHFVENLLQHLQPNAAANIADIGCGEGRFAIQFANEGYNVIGVDIAANRIEKAQEHERKNLHFFVHDMRFPFYIHYFDLAFNLFTSFGYFEHQRDNQLAANSFAAGLKKGGKLVIDYLNKDAILAKLKPQETITRDGVIFDIQKEFDGHHIIKHIRFADAEGQQKHYTERVSAFSLSDFEQLFVPTGMKLLSTFGSYSLAPFHHQSSERLIMIFEKE